MFRYFVFAIPFLLLAQLSQAEARVNSKVSLSSCKEAIQDDLADGARYKFSRKAATSVMASKYRHWINATEINISDRHSQKILCETDRTGKVILFQVKPGRWKI